MAAARRYAWLVFVLFCVLVFLFGAFPGGWFEEPVDRHDTLLMSTFAAGMAVFGLAIALTAYRRGERWAWLAFWFWPVFFVVHGFAFLSWTSSSPRSRSRRSSSRGLTRLRLTAADRGDHVHARARLERRVQPRALRRACRGCTRPCGRAKAKAGCEN